MYKHTKRHIERVLRIDFIRFCLVGGLGFLINFALLTLLYQLMDLPIFLSQLVAGEVALFSNFILHNYWTYASHKVQKSISVLLVQFHATSWVAIIGTALIVSACVYYLHLHYIAALATGAILALAWNFVWSKYVIWKKLKSVEYVE